MDYGYYDTNGYPKSRMSMAYKYNDDFDRGSEWDRVTHHRRPNSEYPSTQNRPTESEDAADIRKKTFCGLVSRFAGKTSMQGIPYINAARLWYAKFIWSLLTLVALAISIIHMYYLISLYYEHNKATQISLGFSFLTMPAITVCHTNPVRKSQLRFASPEFRNFVRRLEKDMLNVEITDKETERPNRIKRFASSVDNFNQTDFYKKDKYRPKADVLKDEAIGEESAESAIRNQFKHLYTAMAPKLRYKIGHIMNDMLISCTFRGRHCKTKKFKPVRSSTFGNCYTLQSENYIVEASGPDEGLTIIMFMEAQENVDAINYGSGLRLTIHHQNTTAFPEKEGFFVSPNTETNVGLRMVNITRLGDPFGTCVDPVSYETEYGITYTRQACQSFCQQKHTIETCGCYDRVQDDVIAKMNRSGNQKEVGHCISVKELKCMYKIRDKLLAGKIQCFCDNPCFEQVYVRSLSNREWPTVTYSKLLIESICEKEGVKSTACKHLEELINKTNQLPKNFIKINIYFEDLNFEKIEEIPDYDDVQFLSDVGGAIGLWIGLSMLSVCEVLQLFVELAEFAMYKCCKINCTSQAKTNNNKSKYSTNNANHSSSVHTYSTSRDQARSINHSRM